MNPRSPQQTLMTRTQIYYTYSLLWAAANEALRSGQKSQGDGGLHFLSSIVLRAFSFEAFINTTAETLVPNFEEFERRRTPDKIGEVFRLLNVTFPGGMDVRPLQTLTEVFHFRNAMAHGRTETIKPEPSKVAVTEKMEKQLEKRLTASWEPFIRNSKFAERAKEDIEQIIVALYNARPKPCEGLFELGGGSGRIDLRNVDFVKLAEWEHERAVEGKKDKP